MKKEEQSFGCGISVSQKGHALSGWILRIVPLFAMLFATVVAKAAGDGDGVKFNPGVRYSQWAINSRAHDFYANTTAFGLAKYKADGTSVEIKRKDSKDKLDYVPGLVAKSMIEAADYYQNFDWSKPWFASVKEYGDDYYNSVPNGGGSLDDLNAVKLYIGIYNYKNASETDKTHAKTAIGLATEGLKAHNNSCSIKSGTLAGDAVVGGWFHKTAYNNQMWLDGAYMGSALLAQIVNFNGDGSNVFGSADKDWNMVFKQLNIVWNMCWNSKDKLMYHAFEANAGTKDSNSHADTWQGLNGKTEPYTFHSAAYWGRANAWYIFALVDALEAMGNAGRTSDTNYSTLKSHLQELAAGIVARQASNGGWYQLLDKTDSFEATSYNSNWSGKPASATNYIETSATAIFSAALFKAARLGLIDAKYKENAKKAFECLVNNYTYLKDGSLEIWGSCRSAGLGGGTDKKYAAGGEKYRDGSNEYYLLGYDVPMVKKTDNLTEGKVLGGFIMAATEYERAYQNQDGSAQILFSYDLKPAYDLTQSGATAPVVEVCGTDAANATYQWYDANTDAAVKGATEAQFIPQTTGNYYCKATVDGTSIQTSATNIKVNSNSSADKQKFTVTATAENGTVEIKDGNDNVVKSGTQVEEGTKLIFTAKANTGYVFDSWTATGGAADGNVYTISSLNADANVTANFKEKNNGGGETGGETTTEPVFSMTVNSNASLSIPKNTTQQLTDGVIIDGGNVELVNDRSSAWNVFTDGKLCPENKSNQYIKITLDESLKDGDVVKIENNSKEFYLSAEAPSSNSVSTANGSYTLDANSVLKGKNKIFVFWSDKSNPLSSITITRKTTTPTTSPLVIAVENVEMNVTDEVTKQPEVKVYGTADKLLTLGSDYTLSFSTDNNNVTINENGVFTAAGSKSNYTEGVTNVTVTATPSAALAEKYTEAKWTFKFTVRKGKMKPVFMPAFKGATIKVKTGTKKTIEVPLNYGGEDVSGYFDVKYSCSNLSGLKNSNNTMTCTFSTADKYTITVSATPKIINQGKDDEFNYADEYDAPDAVTFTVDVSDGYKVPKVTLNPSADKTIYVGEVVDAPAVSVTDAQGTAIDKSKYTMEWTSFAPDVCKVDATTGKIEGVSAGDKLKIQLKVSGDGFEDVFAYLLVSVDDPAKYRVKAPGSGVTYSPMTPLFNQNKTLAVTLGGWSFTDRDTAPVSKEGLTYGDKNKWADDSSKATWVIKGFDYYLPGLTCQNARQEDGACPLPSETQWYDGKLQKVKGGTVDPMFYVPCSGAYLTVEPKTNGKVSVSVFQNGVFDKSGGVYAYRPQRRVFVLDEAGKVVASEATISATGGKLTVADKKATDKLANPYDITNYPCNITGLATGPATTGGGKDSNPSPKVEEVMKHFRGMTSFVMTEAGFQNNVYESNIDNKVTWGDNATPNNGADDNVMGSHGWSVLVDAAVTYTFDVKAGKTYYIYNYGSKLGFYGFSFDEAKGQTVKNYEFDEAAANTIELTKAGELSTAKVNRAMKAGVWTTCVLPFSLNKQQVDAIFGKTYDRDTPNGTQILYFDRVEGTKAIFVRHAYNNIVAGKPFLIKPTKDVASINTAEVEGYPYVTIENTQPAEWCKGNGYVWMASYSNDLTVKEGDCFISNKDGSFKNFVGAPGTLKGFRGYLKNIGTNGVSEAKKLTVGMGSNVTTDETSAIDGILIDGDMPADSVTAADGKVYNLNGQVVATSYRQFQALPGGVYVVNGKKVVK
ncbi:glycoside hydrolase family 88 protein [uncultured Prevotella sp.]|uniref:glycoside hydrolase family 88 protein n=1 Tax=uncultured Prevotella sp. TaxID=159272 RepID=UPI00267325FC|nr:glycoside hydrolase family 88 protein [uncultured Prevotella sp.]